MVFAHFAPEYWAAGLPVIPVRGKRPAIFSWQQFSERLPSEGEKASWLHDFQDLNMGLVLGKQSGICVLDIDTANQELIALIESLLPVKSPWRKVGKKGCSYAFKFNGERTFQVRDVEGNVICELLSSKRQTVLPPSIHPDTDKPYTANCDLISVLGGLPMLPPDFEHALRATLLDNKVQLSVKGYSRVTEYVSKSSRDTRYASVCGQYALDVAKGKMPLVEALQFVEEWPLSFTEQVDGDNVDPQKGVQNLVKFLVRDVRERGYVLHAGWDTGLTYEDKEKLGLDFEDSDMEQTFSEIMLQIESRFGDLAKSEMAVKDPKNPELMNDKFRLSREVLTSIARSPSLSQIECDQLLAVLKHYMGAKVTIASLKKDIYEIRHSGLKGDNHTDIAEHLLAEQGDVRFYQGRFYEWEGAFWEEQDENRFRVQIMTRYRNMPACKKNSDYEAVLKTFRSLVTKDLKDTSVVGRSLGIAFSNGYLSHDGSLEPHNPAHGNLFYLPYRYRPELAGVEHHPRFRRFLTDAWGDDEDFADKVTALQEAICATVMGMGPKMSRAILLYGVAHSGKSVLLRIIESLLPSSVVSAVSPDVWGDKFLPAQMCGRLLNIGGELHESRKIDGQNFKTVIVGETMTVQHKNQHPFTMNPLAAHWFASNHLPQSNDMSEGFLRRWLILSFMKKFPEKLRNVNLVEEIVAEEREAIVAWALSILPRLQQVATYTLPASHEVRIRELLASMDSVYAFLQAGQKIQISPLTGKVGATGDLISRAISAQTVFNEYQTFTGMMGARPATLSTFLLRMRTLSSLLGFQEVLRDGGNGSQDLGYIGITLRSAKGRQQQEETAA